MILQGPAERHWRIRQGSIRSNGDDRRRCVAPLPYDFGYLFAAQPLRRPIVCGG